jgi:glutamyl-Q tRNA(Asp) synthetase
MKKTLTTRFAPSPTGLLHLGHGFSALLAYKLAQNNNGRFYLRIEDIDQTRSRSEFIEEIYQDLKWLGVKWLEPVRIQSEHFADYENHLNILSKMDLLYPCFCTRADIKKEIEGAPSAPHGFDGVVYPQICKKLSLDERLLKQQNGTPYALRLDMEKAISLLKEKNAWPLYWQDQVQGKVKARPEDMGDIVIARKETPTSYHLAVTIDDHLEGVSHVIRGQDLFEATHIHRLLQALLGFETPIYHHHALLTDEDGKRLAKRNSATTLKSLREKGENPDELVKKLLDNP